MSKVIDLSSNPAYIRRQLCTYSDTCDKPISDCPDCKKYKDIIFGDVKNEKE